MEKTPKTVVKTDLIELHSTRSEQKSKIERLQFKDEIDKMLKPTIEFESKIPEIIDKIFSETKLVDDLIDSVKYNIKQTALEGGTTTCIHIYPDGRLRFINCNTTINKIISKNYFLSKPYTLNHGLGDYSLGEIKLIWKKFLTSLKNEIEQFLIDCNFTYKRDDTFDDILITIR